MENKFKYSNDNKRYHTLDYFYKNKFKSKVCKISLNAGFSCPNPDGTVGYGGCIYCSKSGSGEFAGDINDSLSKQFETVKKYMTLNGLTLNILPIFRLELILMPLLKN